MIRKEDLTPREQLDEYLKCLPNSANQLKWNNNLPGSDILNYKDIGILLTEQLEPQFYLNLGAVSHFDAQDAMLLGIPDGYAGDFLTVLTLVPSVNHSPGSIIQFAYGPGTTYTRFDNGLDSWNAWTAMSGGTITPNPNMGIRTVNGRSPDQSGNVETDFRVIDVIRADVPWTEYSEGKTEFLTEFKISEYPRSSNSSVPGLELLPDGEIIVRTVTDPHKTVCYQTVDTVVDGVFQGSFARLGNSDGTWGPLTAKESNKGEKGDKGDPGERGPAGATGATGAAGPKGDTGPAGAVGPTGPQGPIGQTGLSGQTGPRGPQGEKGDMGDGFTITAIYKTVAEMHADIGNNEIPVGAFVIISSDNPDTDPDNSKVFVKTPTEYRFQSVLRGLKGEKGDRGLQGVQGTQGVPGTNGINGAKGDKGDVGPTGATGPKGDDGPQGPKGDKGESGKDGTVWLKGSAMPIPGVAKEGDYWLNTTTGDVKYFNGILWVDAGNLKGPPGSPGNNGADGQKGDKGDKGETGATGPKGDKGDTGLEGPTGPPGTVINDSILPTTPPTNFQRGLTITSPRAHQNDEVYAAWRDWVITTSGANINYGSPFYVRIETTRSDYPITTQVIKIIVPSSGVKGYSEVMQITRMALTETGAFNTPGIQMNTLRGSGSPQGTVSALIGNSYYDYTNKVMYTKTEEGPNDPQTNGWVVNAGGEGFTLLNDFDSSGLPTTYPEGVSIAYLPYGVEGWTDAFGVAYNYLGWSLAKDLLTCIVTTYRSWRGVIHQSIEIIIGEHNQGRTLATIKRQSTYDQLSWLPYYSETTVGYGSGVVTDNYGMNGNLYMDITNNMLYKNVNSTNTPGNNWVPLVPAVVNNTFEPAEDDDEHVYSAYAVEQMFEGAKNNLKTNVKLNRIWESDPIIAGATTWTVDFSDEPELTDLNNYDFEIYDDGVLIFGNPITHVVNNTNKTVTFTPERPMPRAFTLTCVGRGMEYR